MSRDHLRIFWRLYELIGPAVMLVVVLGVFVIQLDGAQLENFIGLANMRLVLAQAVVLIICSVGMTLVLVSGGLDLSVGSSVALAGVCGALSYQASGSIALAALVCIAVSLALGAANGALVVFGRLSPFIVTLGSLGIGRGLAKLIADDQRIALRHEETLPAVEAAVGATTPPAPETVTTWETFFLRAEPLPDTLWSAIGLSPGVIIMLLVVILAVVVMRAAVFGRWIYAIGSNAEAARLCGVPIRRTTWLTYAIAGACFGLAGFLQMDFAESGNPTDSEGFELQVIAAVVIGGASLAGGVGTIYGSVIGSLIIVVLNNGFTFMNISTSGQQVAIGVVIIVAVAIDSLRRRMLRSS